MVHQIMAELARGIAKTLRETRGARIEQDACGFEGARGQYDNFGARFVMGMRGAVDVVHALCFALRLDENMADHCVAHER